MRDDDQRLGMISGDTEDLVSDRLAILLDRLVRIGIEEMDGTARHSDRPQFRRILRKVTRHTPKRKPPTNTYRNRLARLATGRDPEIAPGGRFEPALEFVGGHGRRFGRPAHQECNAEQGRIESQHVGYPPVSGFGSMGAMRRSVPTIPESSQALPPRRSCIQSLHQNNLVRRIRGSGFVKFAVTAYSTRRTTAISELPRRSRRSPFSSPGSLSEN